MFGKTTIKFQQWIVLSASGLVLLLALVFLSTVFGKFRETAERGASDRFELITQGIADNLQLNLEAHARRATAFAAADATALLAAQALPVESALAVLQTAVRQNPGVYGEFLGLANGDFLQAIGVRGDDSTRRALDAPAATTLAVRVIQADSAGQRTERWRFLDAQGQTLATRSAAASYTPLDRPWYQGALRTNGAALTAPYVFASTGREGLTISAALPRGQGAYGIDISLDSLPAVLAGYATSDNAFLGVVDEAGRLLAAHGKGTSALSSASARLVPMADAGSPKATAAAAMLGDLVPDKAQFFDLAGEPHLLVVRRLLVAGSSRYQVVSWAPVSDYTAPVDRARRDVLLVTSLLLLVLVPIAMVGTRGIARSLGRMAQNSERLRALDFSAEPAEVHSYLYEIDALGQAQTVMHRSVKERTAALELAQAKLSRIVDTGIELGRQQDRGALLHSALFGAREIAHCQAATLFLKTERNTLRFALRTSDDALPSTELALYDINGHPDHRYVATHVVLTGETVVIDDIYSETRFDVSGTKRFSDSSGMRVVSTLNVPLKAREGHVLGLFQLMNALDPRTGEVVPFDPEIVSFVEALAAQAAVALENQNLFGAQKALLDAMIQLLAGAIDTKSPYTGGHCERVPQLAFMLAQAASDEKQGPLADFAFHTEDEWREFRIGAWLHDCGKVTTPEFVVDKATKLETIFNRIHEIRTRFEVLLRDARIECLEATLADPTQAQAATQRFEARRAQLLSDFAFVAECNLGSEFMAPDKVERLRAIAQTPWMRHFDDRLGLAHDELARHEREPAQALPAQERLLADKVHHLFERPPTAALDSRYGFTLKVPEHLYNHGEVYNLSIASGTLTEEERFKINEHIIQTIVMLENMPLPYNLKRVPEYAGTHHETLIGTGYPRRLTEKELSVPSRIMAIADVFEALTARDRPYKKAKTLSESVRILYGFKRRRHIDPVLFDLFLTSGIYRRYAEQYLLPEQIDEVDIGQYLGPVPAASADHGGTT
jgi:HD-GYP domain-containing protein (c-di-GMP phosphodiesterase class II)